jgi:hypothetical protein
MTEYNSLKLQKIKKKIAEADSLKQSLENVKLKDFKKHEDKLYKA